MIKLSFIFLLVSFLAADSWASTSEHGLCTDKNFPIGNFHTVTIEGAPPSEVYDCDTYKNARGLVYRGSRPNEQGVDALVKLGIKSDLDLEDNSDAVRTEQASIAGRMNFYSEPMSGSSYSSDQTVSELISIITNPASYPLYIHCERGIDRTGFVVGMLRIAEGWQPPRSINEWNTFRDIVSNLFSRDLWEWGQVQINSYFEKIGHTTN